jgi:hypothetical protein
MFYRTPFKSHRNYLNTYKYSLGASYCRKYFQKGGVSIFICEDLHFTNINLDTLYVDKDIQACAIRLDFLDVHLYILGVHRAPVGNFKQFLIPLEKILRKIYNTKCDYIICGDFNINYLQNDSNRYKLHTLLMSYNLTSIVDFPTRIDKEASSIIDNIFVDKSNFDNYTIMLSINGLLDHDAQLLMISITHKKVQKKSYYYKRKINSHTIADFQLKLSYENWDSIFRGEDVNRLLITFIISTQEPLTQISRSSQLIKKYILTHG